MRPRIRFIDMKRWILLILVFGTTCASAQDYTLYHRLVNNAERLFFLNRDVEGALRCYDSAFAAFDFVFVKDCYMAAQVAYSQADKRYIAYMRKGFQHGLLPWHMKMAPVFKPLVKDSVAMMRNFRDYPALRKKYLAGIKVNVLKRITEMAAKDQTEKRFPTEQYVPILTKNVRYIEELIKHVGFPGDKLIGISQQDVLKELGHPGMDIVDYPWGNQFTDDDSSLGQCYIIPLLQHRVCTYLLFHPYWERLISSGQVHPRDVALLHDWMLLHWLQTKKQQKERYIAYGCPPDGISDGCYSVNYWYDEASNKCDPRMTDSLRANLYIVPLAVDSAKYVLGAPLGFKTKFGKLDSR